MRNAILLLLSLLALLACSTIGNSLVFIDDGGRGEVPILFVHGNGGKSTQWSAQLDYFRAHGHRAAAIDLPGFGKSAPAVNGDYSLAAMAEAIDVTARAIGLDRFVIVGHSYAGAVVAQYAASHPEKVAGVVYLDAAATVVTLTEEQKTQFEGALRADRMKVVRGWFAPMLKPSSSRVSEAVFASVEESSIDAFVAALNSLTTWDPKTLINAYKGPRLAIVAADLSSPASFDKQFADIEVVRIGGAGHWVMMDKPDEVNAAIAAFLARL